MTTDIITRIEQAGEEVLQAGLLWEAYEALIGPRAYGTRFGRLMATGAYLSAAEMLVPEGMTEWTVGITHDGRGRAEIWIKEGEIEWGFEAATPALALAAACLKAYGESERD